MATIRLLIQGKVQGVFYRKTAKEIADANGITGWVRNTADGDVEITASGTEKALQAYINWCRMGPASAKVKEVQITPLPGQPFKIFEVRRG